MKILHLSQKLFYYVCERNGNAKHCPTPFSAGWEGGGGTVGHTYMGHKASGNSNTLGI
jgi:hypothetical protein